MLQNCEVKNLTSRQFHIRKNEKPILFNKIVEKIPAVINEGNDCLKEIDFSNEKNEINIYIKKR